jgi:hypothetical protein
MPARRFFASLSRHLHRPKQPTGAAKAADLSDINSAISLKREEDDLCHSIVTNPTKSANIKRG